MSLTQIETFSFEQIPDEARTARPVDMFRLLFGGCNTFSTVLLGAMPIMMGLSLQASFCAILFGLILGTGILAPMSMFGPRNGTNDPVSSGAHFGIHGRIAGSFLALITAMIFYALAVWSSGDALVGGAHKLAGLPTNNVTLSIAYGVFAVLVLAICVFGFQLMLWVNKIAVWAASLLFVLGIVAFGHSVDWNYAGHVSMGQPHFWALFVGAAMVAMSNPLSFAATLGDWTRYIPRNTPRHRVVLAATLAQTATLVPFCFGIATATLVAQHAPGYLENADYVGGLLAISPSWFFMPVCLIATVGGISTGTTALYGTGLDVSSIFPKYLSRVTATLLVGVLSITIIYVGRFMFSLIDSISTLASIIVVFSCPWAAIMLIGFFHRRGFYLPDDLQVFNRGLRGGHYWFTHGWNLRAMGAWVVGAFVGLAFANMPGEFSGPLASFTGELDLSVPISIVVSAVLYLALLKHFPEPRAVFSPDDEREHIVRRPLVVEPVGD